MVDKPLTKPIYQKIEKLPFNASYGKFRSHRHYMACVAAFNINMMVKENIFRQVTPSSFSVHKLKELNKRLKKFHSIMDNDLE